MRRALAAIAAVALAGTVGRPPPASAAPALSISPASVDFGTVVVGARLESAVLFRNTGDADLLLGPVSVDDPAFAVGGPSGGVPPGTVIVAGDSLAVALAFRPASLGPVSATLSVSSNDPVAPEQTVGLSGSGVAGARIAVSPASFAETLDLGQTVTRDLLIRNTGDLDLEWSLSVRPVVLPLRASLQGVRVLWDRSKGQIPIQLWSTLVGELEGRGAVVDEVLGTGDVITPSLLASYRVYISADVQSGWSTTEASALAAWVQAGGGVMVIGDNLQSRDHYNALMTALGAGITVAGTWGGDTVLTGGAILGHASTAGVTRLRVGLSPRRLDPVVSPAQVIVRANVSDPLVAVATVGVGRVAMVGDELFDNVTIAEADGSFTAHNRLFANQLMDWLAGGLWLKSDLSAGSVAVADSTVAHLLFDATDLPGGTFHLDLHIASNDGTLPAMDVPAELTVIGVPEIDVSPSSLAFPDTPTGGFVSDTLQVRNGGTEILHVSGVASSSTSFTVPAAAFDVAPGDSSGLAVTFYPDSIGTFAGTITITSDAGGNPSLAVGVGGQGIVNCTAPCGAPSLRPADVLGSQGFEIWLDIDLDGNPQPVGSFGFDVNFDPDRLVFLDEWNAASQITLADAQETEPGVVRVGAFASPALPIDFHGMLLQLRFRVDCATCPVGEQSDLFVSGLVEDLAGVRPCCGQLTLAECPTGHGDVNADSTLSATDALCALRIYVNGETLPPDGSCDGDGGCEVAAADVNCDGNVSPADALALYERVLCVADPVPLACFAVSDPDPCGNGGLRARPTLAFGRVDAVKDGWTVAIGTESSPAAFGLELEVPPGAELLRVEAGEAASGWAALEAASVSPGRVRVGGLAGPAPSGVAGTVARLAFRGGDAGGSVRLVEAVDVAFAPPYELALGNAVTATEGLGRVRPNPSPGAVTIEYVASAVHDTRRLRIHDVTGRRVRDLAVGGAPAGPGRVTWDGRDDRGRPVAAGIYFVVLRLDERIWTSKVLRVR